MRNLFVMCVFVSTLSVLMVGCSTEAEESTEGIDSGGTSQSEVAPTPKPLDLSVELAQRIERGRDLSYAEALIGAKAQKLTDELRRELVEKELLAPEQTDENIYVWYTETFLIEVSIDEENRVNRVGAFGWNEEIDQ